MCELIAAVCSSANYLLHEQRSVDFLCNSAGLGCQVDFFIIHGSVN